MGSNNVHTDTSLLPLSAVTAAISAPHSDNPGYAYSFPLQGEPIKRFHAVYLTLFIRFKSYKNRFKGSQNYGQ